MFHFHMVRDKRNESSLLRLWITGSFSMIRHFGQVLIFFVQQPKVLRPILQSALPYLIEWDQNSGNRRLAVCAKPRSYRSHPACPILQVWITMDGDWSLNSYRIRSMADWLLRPPCLLRLRRCGSKSSVPTIKCIQKIQNCHVFGKWPWVCEFESSSNCARSRSVRY